MKILRLGSSEDAPGRLPPEFMREHLIQQGLERELGEPIEIATQRAWPNQRLPEMVRRWMDEEEPDMVTMHVTGYWFMYQSVTRKLRRRWGKFGQTVGQAAHDSADVPWLAYNPVFRFGRRVVTRVIGGETNFTPDEVVQRVTDSMKEIIRHEGVILLVWGPGGRSRHGDHSRKAAAAMEARRLSVTARMREICAQHRVAFIAREEPMWKLGIAPKKGRDGLHADEEGAVVDAAREVAQIVAEIRRVRGSAPVVAAPPSEARVILSR